VPAARHPRTISVRRDSSEREKYPVAAIFLFGMELMVRQMWYVVLLLEGLEWETYGTRGYVSINAGAFRKGQRKYDKMEHEMRPPWVLFHLCQTDPNFRPAKGRLGSFKVLSHLSHSAPSKHCSVVFGLPPIELSQMSHLSAPTTVRNCSDYSPQSTVQFCPIHPDRSALMSGRPPPSKTPSGIQSPIITSEPLCHNHY